MRAAVRTALSVTIANIAGAFVAVTTLSLVERPEQLVLAATGCGAAAAAAIASTFPVNSLVAAIVEGAGVAVAALVSLSLASKRPPHPEREIA